MNGFKGRFTSIKDISDRRRLPRLGKIRLGVKVKHKTKPDVEYPRETDYFVCPEEVQREFGEQPKELPIMFPIEDREIVFPQAYKMYGKSRGLKCIGNGEEGLRTNDKGEFDEIKCPCELLEKNECQRRGHLMVVIPKVSLGGVYQIDVGSYHSIVDINSGIEYVKEEVGRFSWVPLILKRLPKDTFKTGARNIHYTLHVHLPDEMTIPMINLLREDTRRILEGPRYAIPAPEDINPKMDNGGVIDYTDDEEKGQPEAIVEAETEGKEPEKPKNEKKPPGDSPKPVGEFPLLFTHIPKLVIGASLDDVEKLLPKTLTVDQANRVLGLIKKEKIERDEFAGKVTEIFKK